MKNLIVALLLSLFAVPTFAQLVCPPLLELEMGDTRKILLMYDQPVAQSICDAFNDLDPITVRANGMDYTYSVFICNPNSNTIGLIATSCPMPNMPVTDCTSNGGFPIGNYNLIELLFPDGTLMQFDTDGAGNGVNYDGNSNVRASLEDCDIARAIPTLSQWGLIILAMLFLIFGISYIKSPVLRRAFVRA